MRCRRCIPVGTIAGLECRDRHLFLMKEISLMRSLVENEAWAHVIEHRTVVATAAKEIKLHAAVPFWQDVADNGEFKDVCIFCAACGNSCRP
mmetsp:Transcript_4100/g.7920  ORF Transcript_4100/g.7920 Transcript_4100/m.7920 type:complete len:92 (+) Transcript_4100:1559-1834(+)